MYSLTVTPRVLERLLTPVLFVLSLKLSVSLLNFPTVFSIFCRSKVLLGLPCCAASTPRRSCKSLCRRGPGPGYFPIPRLGTPLPICRWHCRQRDTYYCKFLHHYPPITLLSHSTPSAISNISNVQSGTTQRHMKTLNLACEPVFRRQGILTLHGLVILYKCA